MPVKVECESCKAPYTIDERRIPASGLRVRCPKCANTFVIKKPADATGATQTGTPAVPAVAKAPPPAAAPPTPKESDAGLPAVAPQRPPGGRRPAATIAFAGAPAIAPTVGAMQAQRPAVAKPVNDSLDDLPAQAPIAPPMTGAPKPTPAQAGRTSTPLDDGAWDDLPAPVPAKPAAFGAGARPIASPKSPKSPPPAAPAAPAAAPTDDFPAMRAAPGAVAAKPAAGEGADLPAPRARMQSPTTPAKPAPKPFVKGTQLGLGAFAPKLGAPATAPKAPPAAPAAPAAPTATEDDDLPAMRSEAELPSPVARPGGLPGRAPAKPPARPGAAVAATKPEAAELPMPKATRGGDAFADLPAVHGGDLPATRAQKPAGPAPKAQTPDFGELDLPEVASALPAPRQPAPQPSAFGELDLPELSGAGLPEVSSGGVGLPAVSTGGIGLPAVSSGGVGLPAVSTGGVGLPAVSSGGIGLPAVSSGGVGLPAVQHAGANLPSVQHAGANLPSVGRADLPSVAPTGAHLPSIAGAGSNPKPTASPFGGGGDPFGGVGFDSPDLGSAQTMQGPGYAPSASPAQASVPAPGGFGELELPGPEAGGGGFGEADLGLRSSTARGFGEVDLQPAASPSLGGGGGGAGGGFGSGGGFGELDLGGSPGDFGPSANAETLGGSPAVRPRSPSLESNRPAGGSFDTASDDSMDFGPPPQAPLDDRSKGGMGFGEVDLGGGGAAEEDMEFGAIPQADPGHDGGDLAFPRETGGRYDEAPLPRPASTAGMGPIEKPKKKSNAGKVVAALFAILLLGGAGLEFTKYGAFGRNTITDKLNAEKYVATTTAAIKRTRESFADDSLGKTINAVQALEQDIATAPRHQPLLAYAAYANFAQQLRFGKDAAIDGRGRRLLTGLTENSPARTLAEATRDIVAGTPGGAAGSLKQLLSSDLKLEAAITLGELGLRERKTKEAVESFTIAQATEDSARTRSGLMRAYDANGEFANAKKQATDLAAKYPKHVPSRLLLARYAWDQAKDEKEATKWLDELKKPDLVSAAAPSELVDANTLRGNLLLERGRISDARAAFDQAVAAGKGAPAPFAQLGLGEVDMVAGQYPSAIAHFNAASQAMPELTQAKIGVARAKLRQELPGEAKAVLVPLKDPKFAGEIGFWLGQAEEKLSPDKPTDAMKIYEASIKAQPSEVKSYIALAKLQAKVGKPEEAQTTLANAIKAVPPSDKLHLAVGQLKFSQSKYEAALGEFDAALQIQPDNLEALFEKGRALLRMGNKEKMEDGKKALDEVEKKDPKYPNLALEFGFFYLHTNQVAEALKRYNAALDAAPNDVDVKLNVGIAMVENHHPDAETTLRDVQDKCATNSSSPDFCITEARHYLGRAMLDKGSNAEAITYLKQAVDKGDANASYHLYYGWALEIAERYVDAEVEINRTLELDKSKAEAYWLRAEILSRRGQFKEAIAQANEALRQQPTIHAAHATIGFSLMKLQQENEAIAELRKAIEGDGTNPQSAWWRYLVADIASHQGATSKASKEITDAINMVATKDPAPPWLAKAYFYKGEALRYSDKAEAKKAYRTWLEKSVGNTDPARNEAKAALVDLGEPYGGL